MSNKYVSSVIAKYGDSARVNEDAKTLSEIMARQGASLLIDVIAEYTGTTANRFKFHSSDRAMTRIALVDELDNALKERL